MNMQKQIEQTAMWDALSWMEVVPMWKDIAWKTENISGYHEAFNKALNDNAKYAEGTAKAYAKGRAKLIEKGFTGEVPVKKLVTRNKVVLVLTVAGVVHYLGYDKKVIEYVRTRYHRMVIRVVDRNPDYPDRWAERSKETLKDIANDKE
jgi:hypothetical protein